jgi:signal transduction histidine kinase
VAIVNPHEITTNNVVPPVIIEAISADGEVLGPSSGEVAKNGHEGSLQIPPGKRRFEIQYTGLSFTAPGKVRFRHRLGGLEAEWQEAGTKRVAEYRFLKPGDYRFQVIACNNDNVWNNTGATFSFTVLPFFWQTTWFQSASVLVLGAMFATAIFLASRRRLRASLDRLERQQGIERERARIARDIHDDLGASLTRINMLSQSVRSELDASHQAAADVDSIHTTARELTRAMDEIVWAVNPKHDTLDSLVSYLGPYPQSFLNGAGLRCRLDIPLNLPPATLTAEARHNLFLTLKEALNNVVRHAQASEVRISLALSPRQFELVVDDNGCGFDPVLSKSNQAEAGPERIAGGNGLSNMQRRLEEIGGHCSWESSPGHGTRVELKVPFPTDLA